jgi:photosystem II stability/assembly factor-like uncharacterized protein
MTRPQQEVPVAKTKRRDERLVLLVGTRKGAFLFEGNRERRSWKLAGPHFLGSIVHHIVQDPRSPRTLLAAARTGHLGPTIFRSTDLGKSWSEAKAPPAFTKVDGADGRAVDHVFFLTPAHLTEPGAWYAGTSPQGLFRSEDAGVTWSSVKGFNEHPMREKWVGGLGDGTPDGPKLHSILVDPRDPKHLYFGMSSGGVFESQNGGADWQPLNKGVAAPFLPDPEAAYGHDPHCVVLHPLKPDRLYQQNHCGIYRLDRPDETWTRIGERMPKKVGDIGFPIVLHPRDPDTAWVFPMDGTEVWPRTSPEGRPAVFRTRDAGRKWKRQNGGLPKRGWLTVKRQAFAADGGDPVGLYFGTTSGEIWMSRNEGERWRQLAAHLPHIYSITVGTRDQ